jgi:hypothetical protein
MITYIYFLCEYVMCTLYGRAKEFNKHPVHKHEYYRSFERNSFMNCLAGYKIAEVTAHFMYLHSFVLLSKYAKHYSEPKAPYSK